MSAEETSVRVNYRYIRPLAVLYTRVWGPYLQGADQAWKVMGRWLDGHRARSHMRVSYGLFHDNPKTTAAKLLRYDACIPLIPGLEADPSANRTANASRRRLRRPYACGFV